MYHIRSPHMRTERMKLWYTAMQCVTSHPDMYIVHAYQYTLQTTNQGAPAFVRVFKYPDLEKPVASKSFFKADTVDLMWNSTGSHLLVHTHVAVDASNKSYYGENHLYYMSAKGDFDAIVQLGVCSYHASQ